ncbi:MAG: hypothetical protein H7222_02000 [Methylotenera sp.]|nr:hypothetical protein [Oligoflexia bacterium]
MSQVPSDSLITIRRAESEEDWACVRSLCCRTGNGGKPIEGPRFPFFAEFWVGPYQRLVPEWTYLAFNSDSGTQRPVGYLTGCPKTPAFHWRKALLFTFPLFLKTIAGAYPKNTDTRRFLRRFLHLERGPESRFPKAEIRRIQKNHPAHLHMNVEADVRKAGVGRKLLERFEADLGLEAQPGLGIHLFCGEGPLQFYGRTGFKELAKIDFSPGVSVFALGKRLG